MSSSHHLSIPIPLPMCVPVAGQCACVCLSMYVCICLCENINPRFAGDRESRCMWLFCTARFLFLFWTQSNPASPLVSLQECCEQPDLSYLSLSLSLPPFPFPHFLSLLFFSSGHWRYASLCLSDWLSICVVCLSDWLPVWSLLCSFGRDAFNVSLGGLDVVCLLLIFAPRPPFAVALYEQAVEQCLCGWCVCLFVFLSRSGRSVQMWPVPKTVLVSFTY